MEASRFDRRGPDMVVAGAQQLGERVSRAEQIGEELVREFVQLDAAIEASARRGIETSVSFVEPVVQAAWEAFSRASRQPGDPPLMPDEDELAERVRRRFR